MIKLYKRITKGDTNQGFSLIEFVISLSVMSICSLGITALLTSSTSTNTNAGKQTEVVAKAQQRLEMLIALPYSDNTAEGLAPGSHNPTAETDLLDNNDDGLVDESGETSFYTISWTVTETAAGGGAGTGNKAITVTGTWKQTALGQKSVSLSYIKTNILI